MVKKTVILNICGLHVLPLLRKFKKYIKSGNWNQHNNETATCGGAEIA